MNDQDRETGKGKSGADQVVGKQDHPIGPTSIDGLDPSELPDGGRGDVDTDPRKVNSRRLPAQTGGVIGGEDVGIRGTADIADADQHGNRKHN